MNMKRQYIKPEINVIDMDAEVLLMSTSSGDLDGTDWGGDDYTGKEAEAKMNHGFRVDVWE